MESPKPHSNFKQVSAKVCRMPLTAKVTFNCKVPVEMVLFETNCMKMRCPLCKMLKIAALDATTLNSPDS